MFDDPMAREAYRRGASDAYESACLHVAPAPKRAIEEWLSDLASWKAGDPPEPPHRWGVPDDM